MLKYKELLNIRNTTLVTLETVGYTIGTLRVFVNAGEVRKIEWECRSTKNTGNIECLEY